MSERMKSMMGDFLFFEQQLKAALIREHGNSFISISDHVF
jgi:hypothetical protein